MFTKDNGIAQDSSALTGCSGYGCAAIGPSGSLYCILSNPKRFCAGTEKGTVDIGDAVLAGRPRIPRQHIAFIRRISSDHPEWGEDRIALELKLKLSVDHSASTIRRYMVEHKPAPNMNWRQFLVSHGHEILTMDFTTHYLWDYSVKYVLALMKLGTREIVCCRATSSSTLAWVKQQIREATAWGNCPRFLIHDNDGIFGQFGRRKNGYRCALDQWLGEIMAINGIPIPYGAPNADAHIERFMGTIKRECLRHFIFLSEDHLQRTVREFVHHYNEARPHQGLMSIPLHPSEEPTIRRFQACVKLSRLKAKPILGGVHHDYSLAA
ncbi:MAG: integrase core domain-containing protein [Pseudomonadota bacterium]